MRRVTFVALFATLSASAPAVAQTFWVPETGGNWSLPANWDNGVPDGSAARAQFARGGTGSQVVTVDGSYTVGRIAFGLGAGSSVSNFGHTLSGGNLTLANGVEAALIEAGRNDAAQTIATPLAIAGSANALTLANASLQGANFLTLNSLTGTGSRLTVTGDPLNAFSPGVTAVLSGTYGGAGSVTDLRGGVHQAQEGVGMPLNTLLRIAGGTWQNSDSALVTRAVGAATGDIQVGPGTSRFAARAGETVTLRFSNNAATQVVWGSANFNPTVLGFGRGVSTSGVEQYTFANNLDLNGAVRTVNSAFRASVAFTGVVSDSGTGGGLIVLNQGTVALTGANTYAGATQVTQLAVLRAADGVGLPTASNLFFNGGILEGVGATTFTRSLGTGANQARFNLSGGFSATGGPMTVALNGAGGSVTVGQGNFVAPGGTLFLGSRSADALTDFATNVNLAGSNLFLTPVDNTATAADVARVSGVIADTAPTPGTLVVSSFFSTGTVEFTGANLYRGPTVVSRGALALRQTGSIAESRLIVVGPQAATPQPVFDVAGLSAGANFVDDRFRLAPGQNLQGLGQVVGNVAVGNGATVRGGDRGNGGTAAATTGTLTFANALQLRDGGALAVDLNGAGATNAPASRVAVAGAFDLASAQGPAVIRLL